jgi:hypothetical protein
MEQLDPELTPGLLYLPTELLGHCLSDLCGHHLSPTFNVYIIPKSLFPGVRLVYTTICDRKGDNTMDYTEMNLCPLYL